MKIKPVHVALGAGLLYLTRRDSTGCATKVGSFQEPKEGKLWFPKVKKRPLKVPEVKFAVWYSVPEEFYTDTGKSQFQEVPNVQELIRYFFLGYVTENEDTGEVRLYPVQKVLWTVSDLVFGKIADYLAEQRYAVYPTYEPMEAPKYKRYPYAAKGMDSALSTMLTLQEMDVVPEADRKRLRIPAPRIELERISDRSPIEVYNVT